MSVLLLVLFSVIFLVELIVSSRRKKGRPWGVLLRFVYSFGSEVSLDLVFLLIPSLLVLYLLVPSISSILGFSLFGSSSYLTDTVVDLDVIGRQWYWSYVYSNLELSYILHSYLSFDSSVYYSFDSILKEGTVHSRLFSTDHDVVLPVNLPVLVKLSSSDVIHSFSLPNLGIKVDCIPGRISYFLLDVGSKGTFVGQCSELCGVYHGFMPIVFSFVSVKDFFCLYSLFDFTFGVSPFYSFTFYRPCLVDDLPPIGRFLLYPEESGALDKTARFLVCLMAGYLKVEIANWNSNPEVQNKLYSLLDLSISYGLDVKLSKMYRCVDVCNLSELKPPRLPNELVEYLDKHNGNFATYVHELALKLASDPSFTVDSVDKDYLSYRFFYQEYLIKQHKIEFILEELEKYNRRWLPLGMLEKEAVKSLKSELHLAQTQAAFFKSQGDAFYKLSCDRVSS